MDFFGKLNAKNKFGMFKQLKDNNIVNIICGVLLIILIIILIVCLVRKNDNFSNQIENDNENDHENDHEETHMYQVVNDLDTSKDHCPYSREMSKQLAKNNNMIGGYKVKKITMDHQLAKQHNVNGTPTILCTKTGEKSVGLKPFNKVLEDLKLDNNDSNNYSNNNSSSKDILFIGSMNCPFCIKAKKLMDELGLDHKFIESNSDDGKYHMNKFDAKGVPLIIYENGHIIGFNEQKIRNLKN